VIQDLKREVESHLDLSRVGWRDRYAVQVEECDYRELKIYMVNLIRLHGDWGVQLTFGEGDLKTLPESLDTAAEMMEN
jgi:hypothetical protein